MQLPLFYDQEPPIDKKLLTIYRSSAGSGKTFTLVKDYLKLVLRDTDNYRHILAITFTNKASEEMKTRILQELGSMSRDEHTKLRTTIELEFGEESLNIPVPKRARIALEKILHDYGRFSVSTLDHFFAKVVRAFAHELDLPLKYDLDVDDNRAVEYAIEQLYEDLDKDNQLRTWLQDFAFSQMDADKGWEIHRSLNKLGRELFGENFRKGIGDKNNTLTEFAAFVGELKSDRQNFEQTMAEYGRDALQMISDHGLEFTDFAYNASSFANTFHKIMQHDFNFNDRFLVAAQGEKYWYSKSSDKITQIKNIRDAGLLRICQAILEYSENNRRRYNTATNLLRNIYAYGILEYIDQKLNLYRRDRNLLLLADHAFLLHEVIDKKDAPIVYEKVGARYQHILIDEFQDTSLFQWRNILPLVQNVLEGFGNVLIVGDVKQSIYRWRGGDMKLLISGIQQDLVSFKSQTIEKQLDTNFRSAENIVAFNNAFFETSIRLVEQERNLPANAELIADTYAHLHQKSWISKEGYIEVDFVPNEEQTWKEHAKKRTLEVIRDNMARGYAASQFLILVDKWDLGYEMADELLLNGFEVITDKSLKVANNQVVQLLINAIKWLHDREDQLAKSNLLYIYLSLHGSLSYTHHEIFTDIHEEDRIFNQVMPGFFLENLKVFLRLPLYELVETLIATFDIQKFHNNFVLRFQEICLEQSTKANNDLHHFLMWWEESKDELVVITPENNQAIEIMTIHKAKGLQRPIVILPFAGYDLGTKAMSLFWSSRLPEDIRKFHILPLTFEKNLKDSTLEDAYRNEVMEGILERLNMTYVAFTRAEQQLYIFTNELKNSPQDARSIDKLMFRVFDDNSFPYKEKWDLQGQRFTWGNSSLKPWKPVEAEQVQLLQDTESTIQPAISIRSESQRFFMLLDNDKSSKIKKGVKLHYLFEILEDQSTLGTALQNMVNEGLINDTERLELDEAAQSMFEDAHFKSWFDGTWEVLNERTLSVPEGVLRPDRVMIKDDNVVVVDYKTGARSDKHQKQVQIYADALQEMGHQHVEKYLVYFEDREVIAV